MGCQHSQPGVIGGFQVDGNPIGKQHGLQDLILFSPRHDFQVQVTTKLPAIPDNFRRIIQPVLCPHPASSHTG